MPLAEKEKCRLGFSKTPKGTPYKVAFQAEKLFGPDSNKKNIRAPPLLYFFGSFALQPLPTSHLYRYTLNMSAGLNKDELILQQMGYKQVSDPQS
jgi:hypothetical protein